MRVALVTDYWLPTLGGVQTAVKAQRELLRAAGHTATVFFPRGGADADDDTVGLPVSPVFRPDGYPFAWPPHHVERLLAEEFAARRIDVVHTHSEMFAALGALGAARRLGLPAVHTMHGRIDVYTRSVLPWPAATMPLLAALHAWRLSHRGVRVTGGTPYTATRAARAMWRVMVAQAEAVDAVIVPSAHFRDKLAAQGVTTPMTVLPNDLEPTVLAGIRALPHESRAPDAPLRIVWVGRLSPEKRPEVFVDAVRALGDLVRADLVGSGVASAVVAGRAAGLDTLLRHGAVPQQRVLELLAGADLAVSTSLGFDNQPMALLEAIASGVPVLVCDTDLVGVVPPGAAVVAPTPDAAGVAAAVRALAADPDRLGRLRQAAAGAASVPSADGLIAVYEQALRRRGAVTASSA